MSLPLLMPIQDNQSELPEKSEASIDEMNDRTVIHFEQPPSDSSGILEKDENAQAGGNVREQLNAKRRIFTNRLQCNCLRQLITIFSSRSSTQR